MVTGERPPPTIAEGSFLSQERPYVVAARLSGASAEGSVARVQSIVREARFQESSRQYFDLGTAVILASQDEVEHIREEAGSNVIVSPLVFYSIAEAPTYPAHARQLASVRTVNANMHNIVTFRVRDELGRAVEDAEVVVFYSASMHWGYRAVTDSHGEAEIVVAPEHVRVTHFETVRVYPAHSFWPVYRMGVAAEDQEITLKPFPQVLGMQWWAKLLRAEQAHMRGFTGSGVRVAVIDTGVGPHPDLPNVVDGHNFTLEGSAQDFRDVDGHGTHVAGVIAANGGLTGIAPGSSIYAARVFAKHLGAANSDVAEAIRVATDDWNCDILNLSLGGPYDELVEDRVNYASSRGVLCIAAAGNSRGTVEYPGALRETVGVAALGSRGTYPAGTLHELSEPESAGLWGDMDIYAAAFTCRGPEVNASAPGVAIISTVPNSNYAVLDGTSMAAPMVTGVAAIILSRNPSLMDRSPSGFGGARGQANGSPALRIARTDA